MGQPLNFSPPPAPKVIMLANCSMLSMAPGHGINDVEEMGDAATHLANNLLELKNKLESSLDWQKCCTR